MAEYDLDSTEFLFLLTTFGATSAIGIDQKRIFGGGSEIDRVQWERGYRQFQQQAWLIPGDDGRLQMDPSIAKLGSIVADPKLAVTVALRTANDGVGIISYFIGEDEFIEQTHLQNGHIRLANIVNKHTMVDRIVSVLQTPRKSTFDTERYLIPINTFEQSIKLSRAGQITESVAGLEPQLGDEDKALQLAHYFAVAERFAEIEIGIPRSQSMARFHGLVVLESQNEKWMFSYSPPFERVTFERATSQKISARLNKWIDELLR